MVTDTSPLISRIDGPVLTLKLNRPENCNALDDTLIQALAEALAAAAINTSVRIIVLRGAGEHFCSGADISWMKQISTSPTADDARRLGHLLWQLRTLNKPVIALIDGVCIGSGVALACCCDIIIAAETAIFRMPAVHLGAVPAIVAMFVAAQTGPGQARRFCLTGEEISAQRARECGLAHLVVLPAHLEETCTEQISHLLKGGPAAIAATKAQFNEMTLKMINPKTLEAAAGLTANSRGGAEGREGLAAYMEGRAPHWQEDQTD